MNKLRTRWYREADKSPRRKELPASRLVSLTHSIELLRACTSHNSYCNSIALRHSLNIMPKVRQYLGMHQIRTGVLIGSPLVSSGSICGGESSIIVIVAYKIVAPEQDQMPSTRQGTSVICSRTRPSAACVKSCPYPPTLLASRPGY